MPDSINPNDIVRVKLTETGKLLLVEDVDQANDNLRQKTHCLFRVKVPEWDGEGWCCGHFHEFLHILGPHFTMGREMPFTELEKIK